MTVDLKLRREVWERDKGICQICHEPVAFDRLMHADHIVPTKFGGSDALDNLRASHRPCNIRRGDGLGCRDKRPRALVECEICGVSFMGIPKISRYCSEHRGRRPLRSAGPAAPEGEGT